MRLFILWLLIVPPGIVYTYLIYTPQEINWLNMFFFFLFGFLTVYFPLIRNGKPIMLIMWLSVPAFLLYGLFIEIIVMQFSILAMLFVFKTTSSKINIFFFNSTILFILSIISATVFTVVGGKIGSLEFWPIILAVFCYQIVHILLNDVTLKVYSAYINHTSPYISKDSLVNYASVLVILPFSLTLYYLLNFIGVGAFLLLGIPFFAITFVLRLYNNSEKINVDLQRAGDIGHGLTHNLTEDKVIDQFVEKVSEMFNAEYAYLFDHQDGWLELIRAHEHRKFVDLSFNPLFSGQGIAGAVLLENEPIIYSKREEWEDKSKDYTPDAMQSVLAIPISRNQKIEAVLFLSSTKKDAFEEYQLIILDILCSYFTVSVEKARNVQETVMKSERCALTKLYNYSFFDNQLAFEMDKVNSGVLEELSILILDVDHFKGVNDTYGHQSGNDILFMLARILEDMVPEDGLVCRYGGEEFVYLLPGISKTEALIFGEKVRNEVENYRFEINPDLGEDRSALYVFMTVSIGVASAPEDTDEANTLLRNADRALYLGAKQAGRNRVAGYVK